VGWPLDRIEFGVQILGIAGDEADVVSVGDPHVVHGNVSH
jgi:hypothetical protein